MDDWRERAACRGQDTEMFFPIGYGVAAQAQVERARAVCASCPVREQCLAFALRTGQDAGIWGGLTEDERRELRRAALTRRAGDRELIAAGEPGTM